MVGLILVTAGNTGNARLGKAADGMEMREIKKGTKLCLVYSNQIFERTLKVFHPQFHSSSSLCVPT